jgi:hypothetical protein
VGEPLSTLIIGLGLVRAMSPEENEKATGVGGLSFCFWLPGTESTGWGMSTGWVLDGWRL